MNGRHAATSEAARLTPYGDNGLSKTRQIEQMFDSISGTYDALNRVISLGIDRRWRRTAIALLKHKPRRHVLDIATGTADLVIELDRQLEPESIIGVDLSEKMLQLGRDKLTRHRLHAQASLLHGDTAKLPFPDAAFDLVTVSFGVRNFENLAQCLREMCRVLAPAGDCMILEFSKPRGVVFDLAFWLYFRTIVPTLGRLFSNDRLAYRYLPRSVAAFPDGQAFVQVMTSAGFSHVSMKQLSLGICTVYIGTK